MANNDPKRDRGGRFKTGFSGNEYGRPKRKPPNHALPAENRRAVFRAAERMVTFEQQGRMVSISAYEAVLLQISNAAVKGDLAAAKLFAKLVHDTSMEHLTHTLLGRQLVDHMNQVEEQNEDLRKKLNQRNGVLIRPPERPDLAAPDVTLEDKVVEERPIRRGPRRS